MSSALLLFSYGRKRCFCKISEEEFYMKFFLFSTLIFVVFWLLFFFKKKVKSLYTKLNWRASYVYRHLKGLGYLHTIRKMGEIWIIYLPANDSDRIWVELALSTGWHLWPYRSFWTTVIIIHHQPWSSLLVVAVQQQLKSSYPPYCCVTHSPCGANTEIGSKSYDFPNSSTRKT